jgi:hypothetical protein
MPARRGDLPPARSGRKRPSAPPLAPAPPPAGTEPPVGLGFEPLPERRFRDLQDAIRLGIWDYSINIGYNPWHALIAMALSKDTPLELKFDCHKEVTAYLLAKLKSIAIAGEVEHHHTSEPLQVLFARWEQEEEAERASLPPWTPPGLEALDMRQSEDGE